MNLSSRPRDNPIRACPDPTIPMCINPKAHVMLSSLSPAAQLTLRMFGDEKAERFSQVLIAVDRINRRWGKDTVRFAVANPEWRWRMKFKKRLPRYTTRLQEVLIID